MPNVLRILDANANRAREALRVMEEAARFLLDDAALAAPIKALRHDLAAALEACLPPGALSANRDTPGDVGTIIKTEREQTRASAADVAVAAGKRLSESLRAMEEYAKTLGGEAAALPPRLEALRYRGYDLERRLDLALGSGRPRQWRLCVLITQEICRGGDWMGVARAAVEGGADCLQLREKTLEGGELLARAKALVALCRPRGVSVIVNDRLDIALLSGADGVHVGQGDLPCAEVRRLAGRQLIVGVSTSSLEEARRAHAEGADYCGVGPMFATTTKHKETLAGPDYLRRYVEWGRLPHLAIGGISLDRLEPLLTAGVRGIAISSAVCASPDPLAATRALLAALAVNDRAIPAAPGPLGS